MKKPMIALLGAAVCCTQIVSAEVKTNDNTSVDLYVQDGLIGHWDAVDNGGRGIHNTSATKWVNLAPADKAGRIDDIILHAAAIELRDNAIFKKGTTITKKTSGLFGYLPSQPDNVATIEAAVSGITNAVSDYTGNNTPSQYRRCLLSLVTITKYQQVFLAPDMIQRSYKDDVPPEHLNDYALYFDDGAKQTPLRPSPTLSDRLDALTVSATYNKYQSGAEPCAYESAYANGAALVRLTGFDGGWDLAGENENVTTFGGRAGMSGDGDGTIVGSVKNENMTRNYSMHSIRFYDRMLGSDEVRWNAFVDHYRFEGAVSGVDVVSDGEGAYTVTGTFIPLDFAGNMTVRVSELNAADETVTEAAVFTIKPGEGDARSFSFTGRPPRCLVTVTVSQTYDGKTLEKSLSGFKTWEDSGTGVDVITWTGKWTNPITPWYASEDNWSENRSPINADKRINIGDQENESYAVRIGVPIALGPFANTLFVACKAGQSNRLEVVNGASLETKGTLVVSGSSTMTGSAYGELILSNGTVKAQNIYAGYAPNKLHGGRIVVEGNSLLEASVYIWFGKNSSNPDATRSNVALLIRGGTVRCNPTESGNNYGLFYGGPGMTIESGRIEAARIALGDGFNIYGGVVESSVGVIFNSANGVTLTQTGGTVRAPVSTDQQAGYYDMSGGKLVCPSLTTDLRGSGVKNRAIRFRTIGSAPKVSIADFGLGSKATDANKDWFVFWDYALGADGRVSAHENAATNVFGYYHVAPLGGVQLIHSNCVTLVHNAEKDLVEDTTRWSGHGIETIDGDMWDYGISADKRRMEATLKSSFKLTNGELLTTPVDRGYLDITGLPPEGSKGLKSLTVKLALEPQTGTTLDDIIARINESGAGTARVIDGSADWNVLVEVPVTSVEKGTGERVALDFTEYNTFKSTNTEMATPMPTVRAKIKGARVTVLHQGLILIVK